MITSIPMMLRNAAVKNPHASYLNEKTDSGWESVSLSGVRALSHSLAAAILERGWTGPMAILAEGRTAWVVSELSVFLCGSFSVPLSIKLTAEEIAYRIVHSQARIVVCSRLTLEKVLAASVKFDQDMVLLCLDEGEDLTLLFKEKAKSPKTLDFVNYKDLLAEGDKLLQDSARKETLVRREEEINPKDTATVCYTSGTTGNPKGIMLSHGNYYANVRDALAGFPLPDGTKLFVILPIDHSFAHTIALYAPMQKLLHIYFVDARGGAMGILRNIPVNMKEVKPNLILTVPSLSTNFMQKILKGVEEKGSFAFGLTRAGLKARIFMNGNVHKRPAWYKRILPWFPAALAEILVFKKVRETFGGELRYFIGGGAHLEIKQQEFFKAIGIPVFQGYGLTEASPVVSTNNVYQHKLGTSGQILPNVECKAIDDQGRELPRGVKGQLIMRGENLMIGYLHNPEATAQALVDGWLHSGDLGFVDEDGFLHVEGREKALLITEDGEKYSPEAIEDAIVACSNFISQCMLWCDHRRYVVALITLDQDALRAHIEAHSLSLTKPEHVLDLLKADFNAYTKDRAYQGLFPPQWKPVSFVVSPRTFTEAEGLINSTLKMVRFKVLETFRELIDYQYLDEGSKTINPKNVQTIREMFF